MLMVRHLQNRHCQQYRIVYWHSTVNPDHTREGHRGRHTMKRTVNGEFYGDPEHALGVRIVSEFELEGDCYYLVEAPTTMSAALSSNFLGGAGVGHCEINGR